MRRLIKNATIVNEGHSYKGSLLTDGAYISKIISRENFASEREYNSLITKLEEGAEIIDADALTLMPGVIDDHVHFREPGGESEGTIESESRAAVLGGVTSFMDMPNNTPATTTIELLEQKYERAAHSSYCNYSFYLGASGSNLREIENLDPHLNCGVKVFMGSSTGSLLVESEEALEAIFGTAKVPVAVHCEDNEIITSNLRHYLAHYRDNIPPEAHPYIRSSKACSMATSRAVALALKYHTRLHILHLTTAEEVQILRDLQRDGESCITAETSPHYLWFCSKDYSKYGNLIKCNPAIKGEGDREELLRAVREGVIRVIGTDHAPHRLEDKLKPYKEAPSGLPLIQYSLLMLLELYKAGALSIEEVVSLTSHGPAECFNIEKRGYIREGYFADMVLINLNAGSTPSPASRCGWSPFSERPGTNFSVAVELTMVNGAPVVVGGTILDDSSPRQNVMRLTFNR